MSDPSTLMTEGAMKAQLQTLKADVAVIEKKVPEIAHVTSPEGEASAAEFCQQVKLRIDQSEQARSFLVRPLNDHVKRINATFKETTAPLEAALEAVKRGLVAWRSSEDVRLAKDRAEVARRAAVSAAAVGDIDTLQIKAAEVQAAQTVATKKVATASGKTTFRKVWKFEVVDPLVVPAAYWVIDDKKVAADVKLGRAIPGVKAWQEETPVFA